VGEVSELRARRGGRPRHRAHHEAASRRADPPDERTRLVLEGGGIETDGQGTLLVTEEWLLSDEQVRNPGLDRGAYERAFRDYLGIRETIWLGEGCVGDDTHGHVDDIARFVAPGVIVLAYEDDPADDENHRRSVDNMRRLELAVAERGALKVVKIPYPRAVTMNGERLPGQLCELLHRQRRCARADRSTTATTAWRSTRSPS
jgi:agmatine deiminase